MMRVTGTALAMFSVVGGKQCPTKLFDETNLQRGDGTFYDDANIGKFPNNGNCGFCKLSTVLNDRWRVALSYEDYGPNRPQYGPHGRGGSAACGMCIKFRFPESTNSALPNTWSDALVVDSCTGCKQGDVDFGVTGVQEPYDGRHPVEWYAEPCPVDKNECKPFYEETDGKWVLDFPALGEIFNSTSMKVRLTSIYGEQLDDVVAPIVYEGTNLGHNCASTTSTANPLVGKIQFKNTEGTGILKDTGGIHGCGIVPSNSPHPGSAGTSTSVGDDGAGVLIMAICGAFLLGCCCVAFLYRRHLQHGTQNDEQRRHTISGTRNTQHQYIQSSKPSKTRNMSKQREAKKRRN